MRLKYWLIVVLATVYCVCMFFNIKIFRANAGEQGIVIAETDAEIQRKIQEQYGAEFLKILEELKLLKMEECTSNFLAKLVVEALLEKPFAVEPADRIGLTKSIVTDLCEKNAAVLPEENKIELFLAALAERVSGSKFLTTEEYAAKYGGSYTNKENNVDLDQDKFSGAFYLKFNQISDNTFNEFHNGLAGVILCDNPNIFPAKYVLDFRGSKGPVEIGARLAELFFPVNYDKESVRGGLYDTTFNVPPQLILFNRIHRPFSDPKYWDYWKDVYCYTVNPLFEKMLDDNMKLAIDKRFDPYTITVKNSRIEYFDGLIDKFNATVNKTKIIILVDSETSGAGEVLAALLKNYKNDVTIIGEPTVGNVLMHTVYNIECAREEKEKTEPPLGKPVSMSLITGDPRGETKEKISLGVLVLTDSYWYNPDMDKDYKLRGIHRGGITPDYIVFKKDGEERIIEIVKDLLNK